MAVAPLGIVRLEALHYYVHDLDRSRRFYTERLDFAEVAASTPELEQAGRQRSAVFEAGGVRVVCSQPAGEGGPRQRQLETIALLGDAVDRFVPDAAVVHRIHVTAARQHECRERLQRLRHLLFDRRDDQRDRTDLPDHVDVLARDRERLSGACPPVAGDADQRSHRTHPQ